MAALPGVGHRAGTRDPPGGRTPVLLSQEDRLSDERLRDLERRFRESGAIDDEARWLAARARTGALHVEGLELAAWLGHEAAAAATGLALDPATGLPTVVRGPDLPSLGDLLDWIQGLDRFDRESARRVALALAARHLREVGGGLTALEAATLFVLDPSDEDARRRLQVVANHLPPRASARGTREAALREIFGALAAEAAGRLRLRVSSFWRGEELARLGDDPPRLLEELLEVRSTLVAEVAPWALGLRDPLAELDPADRVVEGAGCRRDWDELETIPDTAARRCPECRSEVREPDDPALDTIRRVVLHRRRDGRTLPRACARDLHLRIRNPSREPEIGRCGGRRPERHRGHIRPWEPDDPERTFAPRRKGRPPEGS